MAAARGSVARARVARAGEPGRARHVARPWAACINFYRHRETRHSKTTLTEALQPERTAGTRVDKTSGMAKSRKREHSDPSASESLAATANDYGGNSQQRTPDPDRISMRAYELYLARGGNDGQAWDDWLAAERELTQGASSRGESDE